MNEEQLLFNLIKKDCETNGYTDEAKIAKMASLMNIHPDRYQKIVDSLIEARKVSKNGKVLSLV